MSHFAKALMYWRLLLMVPRNPRHTWHSAQSQFLPWPWGMLAGWQQPESRLIKNVTIVVTVRSSATTACTTGSCCLETKGYDTYFSCVHTHTQALFIGQYKRGLLEGIWAGFESLRWREILEDKRVLMLKGWSVYTRGLTENPKGRTGVLSMCPLTCTCCVLVWIWTVILCHISIF